MDNVNGQQKQHLALRVALDTMKDRCILQQKLLKDVEEENQKLRERLTQNANCNTNSNTGGGVAETFQLRLQVSELQRLNEQLQAHINMVSSENRKLWSRLSQIAKESETSDQATASANEGSPRGGNSGGGLSNQNLIRSKTFTLKSVNSPNPNVRQKTVESCESDMRDISLEEGEALEVYGDGDCTNKPVMTTANEEAISEVTMGFGYLNDDSSSATQEQDFNAETKKCIENLAKMRQEAMKQQKELNSVFALLESRIALQPCPDCAKKSHKPEMADKSLETDESLNNDSKYINHNNHSYNFNELPAKGGIASVTPLVLEKHPEEASPPPTTNHLNILQEKILADEANKICPMCGKLYDSTIPFESFCEHVEEHFRDESLDLLHSMENNYEFISHTVGDF
ncbi:C2H2-type zinc binding domain-containing protein spindle-F [Musca autumnalis]|uniref:C2H2-type zinc binding domain-containing protein spindle-F n=1 Tax=Musca autumnalis TaxID=221902 RepID=UPI003CEBDD01